MKDYFGFQVQYVQNVTDIDDKVRRSISPNQLF